jgi:hypothetical protein
MIDISFGNQFLEKNLISLAPLIKQYLCEMK